MCGHMCVCVRERVCVGGGLVINTKFALKLPTSTDKESWILNLQRSDSRHNIILQRSSGIIKGKLSNFRLIANLPRYPYQRPPFLTSDLRPDIFNWNEDLMKCYIIELTYPCEKRRGTEIRKILGVSRLHSFNITIYL